MDFLSHASHETSVLVEQLLARRSETALRHVQALREALEAATRELQVPVDADQEVAEFAARLAQAAEAEIRRTQEQAARDAAAVRVRLDEQSAEAQRLATLVAQAQAEAGQLKTSLHGALERAESAERDLALTVDAHGEIEAALRTAESECRQLTQTKAQQTRELSEAQADVERLRVEAGDLRAVLEQTMGQRTELEQTLAQLNGRIEDERRAAAAERQAIEVSLNAADAARHQLAEQIRELEAALQDAVRTEAELRQELAARTAALDHQIAAAAETAAKRQTLIAERDALAVERRALLAERDGNLARIRALEADLPAVHELRGQRDALVAELESARDRLAQLTAQASGDKEARKRAATENEIGSARLRMLEEQLGQAAARTGALERAVAERDTRIRQLETTSRAEVPAATGTAGASAEGSDAETLRFEVDRMVALFDASARAVSEMATAGSSSELLGEMVKRLAIQFSRVAWFRLKGNRLEGEHQIGFDDAGDFAKLIIPLSMDSLLTRAVHSGTAQSAAGADVAVRAGTPFGGSPTSAVALPIVLNGTTIGVLYADDSDMPESARGPYVHESSVGFARLLAGQVSVLLIRHTHELKTLAELRQYAATLLQEAQAMHQADLDAGKSPEQVRARLKENVECASQLYAYRAAMEGTAAAALLDQQIASELETGTPFAEDLAAVFNQMGAGDVRITAEAS